MKGSITIFSLLSLLLITAALFALLEGARVQELKRFAKLQSENAMEAVFSNYNLCLWEDYHLLGTNVEEIEEILQKIANGRTGNGTNFLKLQAKQFQMSGDTRITDNGGRVFIQSVSTYMKDNLLYESAKEIYNQYEAIKNMMDSSETSSSKINDAIEQMQKLDTTSVSEQVVNSVGTTGNNKEKKEKEKRIDVSQLLEEAKKWKENGVLELVLKDTSKVSSSAWDFSNGLLLRQLPEEECSLQEISWKDRILLQQYLLTYMSNFRQSDSKRALSYEVEYLLGEKSSDKENLQNVVSKLLAIREAANFLYLVSDPAKNQQVELLANSIGGVSLNPAIIKVIKVGILTAWAMAESILDVRSLLEGKRIAFLKSNESWTVELENILDITKDFTMAKECKWGLSYENYLGVLLLFEEENHLAMCTMSAQEATIRKKEGDEDFGMDQLVIQASAEIDYSYKEIFPFSAVLNVGKRWKHEIPTQIEYGYYH